MKEDSEKVYMYWELLRTDNKKLIENDYVLFFGFEFDLEICIFPARLPQSLQNLLRRKGL